MRPDGRRHRADGPRGPGAAHLRRLRDRRHPARPQAVPRPGAARDRGPRPRRRRLPRQDRHPHRGRHGRHRAARRCGGADETYVRQVLGALGESDPRPNASLQAIIDAYPDSDRTGAAPRRCRSPRPASTAAPRFSEGDGENSTWLLGAPDVLLPAGDPALAETERLNEQGLRVLLLARTSRELDDPDVAAGRRPDRAGRPGAAAAPRRRPTPCATSPSRTSTPRSSPATTRSRSARSPASSGLPGAEHRWTRASCPTDRDEMAQRLDEGAVFGRVTPQQKRDMVGALQSRGHTVAMTGDGVNDVLALKDADIGVSHGLGLGGDPGGRADRAAQQQLRDAALGGRRGPPGHRQHHPGRDPVPRRRPSTRCCWPSWWSAGRSSTRSCPAT